MDKKNDPPRVSREAPEVYNRLLERVYLSVENLEERSWPFIKEKIEEAAEIELAAREMTREEMDLLKAYLQRDLRGLGTVLHKSGEGLAAWLDFDLNILEYRLAQMLTGIADRTRLEQAELQQRLAHEPDQYLAGEVAGVGTLVCMNCGTALCLTETRVLESCSGCGGRYFQRQTRLSPR